MTKDLSSFIKEKFSGFPIVRSEIENKTKKLFLPVDIVFNPTKHRATKINCYFSSQKHFTYRSSYSEAYKIKHRRAFECYYCSNFYLKNKV